MSQSIATLELTHLANVVHCCGAWTLAGIASLKLTDLALPPATDLIFDGSQISNMDTAGASTLCYVQHELAMKGKTIVFKNFQPEHDALLKMVQTHPIARTEIAIKPLTWLDKIKHPRYILVDIGQYTVIYLNQLIVFLAFVGETAFIFGRSILFPKRIRWRTLFANIQTGGLQALPIVGLMAFLMGIVIAYQAGVQLSRYGANILIVDLVGISLLREIAPLLTAIIVAGRSGSAYTAQIGTMRITDEIDALRTLGISPMELLVIPKLLSLLIALPLLSVFADLFGILGGMTIATLVLDVSVYDFFERLPQAVSLRHYVIGLGKSPMFAAIIAIVGCYQGFQVQGGADSLGKQVTTSVVQAIFLVLVADAVFSVLFSWVGI